MAYSQPAANERYQIAALQDKGCLKKGIAKFLGKSPPEVSRELRRNRGQRGYRPKQAHELAVTRCKASNTDNARRITPEMLLAAEAMGVKDFSPEQVSNRLHAEAGLRVSHEALYQHICADKAAGGTLHNHLRCQKKRQKALCKWPKPPRVHPQPRLYRAAVPSRRRPRAN